MQKIRLCDAVSSTTVDFMWRIKFSDVFLIGVN